MKNTTEEEIGDAKTVAKRKIDNEQQYRSEFGTDSSFYP
ncbi:uncharacterized protein G2W53_033057 [Senna tora]|uniref:Uncharacterized protein n=1 Tax=Senna tora TaxID=362788 RepID=A0A834SYI9_9FABA|nr:uncharacterized protein G2W53_033057 [Senna tora]